jgi:hypothetical protein
MQTEPNKTMWALACMAGFPVLVENRAAGPVFHQFRNPDDCVAAFLAHGGTPQQIDDFIRDARLAAGGDLVPRRDQTE